MKFKMKTKEENIRGYVLPTEWDNDDKVIGASIQTETDDFEVDQNGTGKELLNFLDKEVEVTGMVRQNRHGTKIITVSDYEVLDESDDEDDYQDRDRGDIDFGNGEDELSF